MDYERYANYEWLASHGDELLNYSGKWVAIAGRKLVGTANSLRGLLARPTVKKEKHPFLTKIPLPEELVGFK